MDTIRLGIGRAKDEPRTAVDFVIHGRNLLEAVREVELPFRTEEGHPEYAGDYDGLPPEYVFLEGERVLATEAPDVVSGERAFAETRTAIDQGESRQRLARRAGRLAGKITRGC